MTQTQKNLLKLFSEIDKICKENDIDYYIAGGSTIGAIRHEGFIPWDDDFDIMMTRKNYLKFVEYCRDNLPEDRVLECQELNRGYHNMFARYTDTSMTTIHHPQLYHKDAAGFVIDIMPLDPLPNADEAYKEYLKNIMLYSDLLNSYSIYSFRFNFNAKEYFKYKIKMWFVGRDKVLKEMEAKLFAHDEETATHYAMRWGGVPLLFEKKMYEGKRYVDFFGMKGQVPYRTSDYLVQHYGDTWYLLPPNQEQQAHDAIFSTTIDQASVRKVLDKKMHPKFSYLMFTLRKCTYFLLMKTQRTIKKNRRFLKARAIEFDINKFLNDNKDYILSLDQNLDYDTLNQLFSEYFSVQLSRGFSGREDYLGIDAFYNPILFKIDDELFEIAIKTLINKNGMASALRLMDIYEQHGHTLSENLVHYKELLLLYRSLVSRKDVGEDISDKARIKEVIDTFPCTEMFINFALELYENDKENYNKILEYAIEHAPEEDLVVKAQLDQQELDFDVLLKYIKLYSSSPNGLLRLSIKKIFECKKEIILSTLNGASDKVTATHTSLQLAKITPETREYISFYIQNGISSFNTVDLQKEFYLSFSKIYRKISDQEELVEHFRHELTNAYSEVFGDEYLTTCFAFLTKGETLDQTNERLKKIIQIESNTQNTTTKLWCKMFMLSCYRKLGMMNEVVNIFKTLISQIGINPIFDAILAIYIKSYAKFIRKIIKKLKKKFIIKKYKKIHNELIDKEQAEILKEDLFDSIINAVKTCFATPKEAFDTLNTLGIFNLEKFETITFKLFEESQISTILDSWSIESLICLCRCVEIHVQSFKDILDEQTIEIINQNEENEENENEQFEDVRSRATTLLLEIDKVCKDNDITYALFNSSTKALRKEKLPVAKIKVIMSVNDFDKFVKIMENNIPSDRSFESLNSNASYQSFSAKYFDLNSTKINLLDPYSKIDAGICIEILPVCPVISSNKLNSRLLQREVLSYTLKDIVTTSKHLKAYVIGIIKSIFTNKEKSSKKLYDDLVKAYSNKESEKYFVKEYGLDALVMKENPFDELLEFNVDSIDVKVPRKINRYLKRIKRLPKTNVYKNENKTLNRIVSKSCGREEFISLYKKEIDEFYRAANKHLNLQRIVTKLNRRRRKNWRKANLVAHKFIKKQERLLMQQERLLMQQECKLTRKDYIDNLEKSNAKAMFLINS